MCFYLSLSAIYGIIYARGYIRRKGNKKRRKHKRRNKRDTQKAGGMMLSEHAKAARRAYKAEWARKNPDKVRAQQERYWAKRAAKAAEQTNQEPPAQCVERDNP